MSIWVDLPEPLGSPRNSGVAVEQLSGYAVEQISVAEREWCDGDALYCPECERVGGAR